MCRFLKPFSNIVWINIKFNGMTFYFYPLNSVLVVLSDVLVAIAVNRQANAALMMAAAIAS